MFTNKKNNAKMAWDYDRDLVCIGTIERYYRDSIQLAEIDIPYILFRKKNLWSI